MPTKLFIPFALGLALLSSQAPAAESPPSATMLKVFGSWDMLSQYKDFEKPFWTEAVPKLSEGRLGVELTPFNQAGLKGSEMIRLMRLGMADFGTTVLSYVSAEDPIVEGVDLGGLAPDIATARKVADTGLPALSRHFEKKYGIRVLALWPYPAQMLLCKGPITGLDSLKGRRIRVSLRTTSDLIESFGAVTLSVPFDETYAKIKDGSVDCLVTGTLPAYTAKFYEVTTHLYNLPLGWSMMLLGVNSSSWDKLESKDQTALREGIRKLSDDLWQAAESQTALGIACNTGSDRCTSESKGSMTLVEASDSDRSKVKHLLKQAVVKRWFERCGSECSKEWSKTVGKVIGLGATP